MESKLSIHNISKAIDEIFKMYDTNKNAYLEDKELIKYLNDAIHVNKKLTKTHLKEFMEKFDVDGDGKISKQEFLKFLRNFM
jgi:Ca2+-binding EF-hand superfamily protein